MSETTERFSNMREIATWAASSAWLPIAALALLIVVEHLNPSDGWRLFVIWFFAAVFILTGRMEAYCEGRRDAYRFFLDRLEDR